MKNYKISTKENNNCRYLIGIDLGTTNSSVAYIDKLQDGLTNIEIFHIPQISNPGVVEKFELLPSFFYLPIGYELSEGAIELPWNKDINYVVGKFAREQGAIIPNRLISSVKSWLCNNKVDRYKKILPWNKDDQMVGFSPVEISSFYLEHIKNAWNYEMANSNKDYIFENQEIVITVPASFDDSARELTLKAAEMAGLKNVILIEEPQASFYCWLYKNNIEWNKILNDDDIILICDVGGGTTDFSLIHAVKNDDNYLQLKRVAVGDHILLGGDNMDMAIAYYLEQKHLVSNKTRLDPLTWISLCMKSRIAKEKLLSNESNIENFSVLGKGKNVIGSTLKFTLTYEEVSKIILDGFFNEVNIDNIDKKVTTYLLRENGLPYTDDPSISNHLAKFLKKHINDFNLKNTSKLIKPNKILYNGGVFKAKILRDRLTNLISSWFNNDKNEITILDNPSYDLSVSIGAAYYALTKSGSGIYIKSGSARSYYIGVDVNNNTENVQKAICIVPRGLEEGKRTILESNMAVITNQPVQFTLYSSTTNDNKVGELVDIDNDNFIKLPPLFTCLNFGKKSKIQKIDVNLSAYLTEVGTIDIYCISKTTDHRWKLQFNFRKHENELQTENNSSNLHINNNENEQNKQILVKPELIEKAGEIIETTFLIKEKENFHLLNSLTKKLENHFNFKKEEWPFDLMRKLFNDMIKVAQYKTISPLHEEKWFNLTGFLLRPGFGAPMDDWRVKEALRCSINGIFFKSNKNSVINYYIFLRRIAGGMTSGQQQEIFNRLKENLYSIKKQGKFLKITGSNQELVELLRMIANFELISESEKIQLGNWLAKSIKYNGPDPIIVWVLSRLGARKLMYGGLENVVKPEVVEDWINVLLNYDWIKESYIPQLVILMARITTDRKLDISIDTISKIQKKIESCPNSEYLYDLLMNLTALSNDEHKLMFGESLPNGIVLNL